MSSVQLSRRTFLTLPLVLLLSPLAGARAPVAGRKGAYTADVGILYEMLSFHVEGTIEEAVDRDAGRYEVRIVGEGTGVANRIESTGSLRGGRWAPARATSYFQIRGRESRSDIKYDWQQRSIQYHFRGETFFLRRLRVADDVVAIPEGTHVDDVISAVLNYADGQWPPRPDGSYQTLVVRRKKGEKEGPDDVQAAYRAELVPFTLKVVAAETGKPSAQFDLTRFSSWARENQPARVVFGSDRRPESIVASLMLGTSINIRLRSA